MKHILTLCLMCSPLFTTPLIAGPMDVLRTAQSLFDRLPDAQVRSDYGAICGMGGNSNPGISYCTTDNLIYVSDNFAAGPFAAYEMAHVLGHAIQVRHGVADVALREISRRRDEEPALRGMVTRQVECVAGVLMVRAGEARADLARMTGEPFTRSHWGRNPLNEGPRVSIGLAARVEWYNIGYDAAEFAACSVGEMSSALIVAAEN